jgi:putative DNA primase/helicase
MVERAEGALIRRGVAIYQSGGKLVRPVKDMAQAAKGRKTHIARLVSIEGAFLKAELTKYVDFLTWKNKEERKGIPPHNDLVSAMLGRYGRWKFPTLTGVICAPTLRPDGSILAKEGFDDATGLLVLGPLPEMPEVKDKPSREDAERAIKILDRLLVEFPFVDKASRSVELSGFLSTVCRAALGPVPMHASSAPAAATGKSYMNDLVAGVAIGDYMPVIGADGIDELIKRLDTQVIKGVSILSLDNVSFPLGGDILCQIIERHAYNPRILGKSEGKERRNTHTIFASGNNLRIKNDATRRVLLARLDAKMERPETKEFRDHPFEEVLRNRGRYLWAALTVVKAYIAAGRPSVSMMRFNGFEEWSDLIRSSLVWLGYDDPVLTQEEVRANDPSR